MLLLIPLVVGWVVFHPATISAVISQTDWDGLRKLLVAIGVLYLTISQAQMLKRQKTIHESAEQAKSAVSTAADEASKAAKLNAEQLDNLQNVLDTVYGSAKHLH